MERKKIAVIASRLKCVDAISIEAEKWTAKYVDMGHSVHLIAGKFGEPVELPHLIIPEMDYKHPEVRGVKRIVFGAKLDKAGLKAADILLENLVKRIRGPLRNYLVQNRIDMISVEDALVSLKNLPLALALADVIDDLKISTISRTHYLPWKNEYFTKFSNLQKTVDSLPPDMKCIVHVTSTAGACASLAEKRKMASKVIPHTVNLSKLRAIDDYNRDFRQAFGIRDDQLVFLQPTRVKRNKGVEHSIKLVSEINQSLKKDHVLMLTGSPVYSRQDYFNEVVKKAARMGVKLILADDRIFLGRHQNSEQKFYSIDDAYAHADFVLYPNSSDAFGNPVIEAAAYRKPLLVNKYPNLDEFLSKGFKFVVMDQKVTNETVSDVCELILDPAKRASVVEGNFQLVREHYSAPLLGKSMYDILSAFDQRKSLMSRFSSFIPSRFRKPQERREEEVKRENIKKSRDQSHGERRRSGPAGRAAPKPEDEAAFKNRKGGYREPKRRKQEG